MIYNFFINFLEKKDFRFYILKIPDNALVTQKNDFFSFYYFCRIALSKDFFSEIFKKKLKTRFESIFLRA